MKNKGNISIKTPGVLIFGIILAVISAAICMQIMGQFGTTPNTSLIGAVLVMVVARIPLIAAKRFRNLERQNYVISMASSAGFAAANCGFIAIATMVIMGRDDLLAPIALGALASSAISVFVVGRIYDSKIFPAGGAWPMGVAVASAIEAGDEGGKKGFQLLQGLLVGSAAAFFGLPAAAVGIAFIANMFSTVALGLGMILRGYSAYIFGGFDIGASNIAQGVMIGAGAVALVQIFLAISKGVRGSKKDEKAQDAEHTVSDSRAKRNIALSAAYFMGGAVLIALLTGIFADMGAAQAALWTVFSGLAAIVVMLLVGTASMHSGWAPTFAVVTICMTIGIFAGFPPLPLAVMVGYLGSVGPVMADTGISLKTGWIIRGKGSDTARELAGRRRQIIMKQLGVMVGIAMSVIFGTMLIRGNVVPPMSIFYADAVASAAEPALLGELALWAIPGAALQAAFGNKSVGLMLATGLLINNPIFGLALLVAIAARLIVGTKHMAVRGPGLIAGDGLFGFGANILRVFL